MAESLADLRNPVVVVAFQGWNDASDAATNAVNHLGMVYDAETVFEIDGEDYYDFQVNRPQISFVDGIEREIEWPSVKVSVAALGDRDIVLVSGPEPNMRWRSFTAAIVSALRSVKPTMVVILGAMLTDSPHSRPLPVTGTCNDAELATRLGLEPSNYEGPTGIVGVLAAACADAGFNVTSLWASVPHYVSDPPNPKATLALLSRLEEFLGESIDPGDLSDAAAVWEQRVDELVADDDDITDYVRELESRYDTAEATGEEIAQQFERYLRRREG